MNSGLGGEARRLGSPRGQPDAGGPGRGRLSLVFIDSEGSGRAAAATCGRRRTSADAASAIERGASGLRAARRAAPRAASPAALLAAPERRPSGGCRSSAILMASPRAAPERRPSNASSGAREAPSRRFQPSLGIARVGRSAPAPRATPAAPARAEAPEQAQGQSPVQRRRCPALDLRTVAAGLSSPPPRFRALGPPGPP